MKTILIVIALILILGVSFILFRGKNDDQAKTFSAAFHDKEWRYSVDEGIHWTDGAQGALKGFDENGQPIHVDPVWGTGKWQDENTITWVASNGSKATWKVFGITRVRLTEEEIEKALSFSKEFKNKEWYYSTDDGKTFTDRAEGALRGFDQNGSPVHVDPVWGTGKWEDENTITWVASNESKSLWKALGGAASSLSNKEIAQAKVFAEAFKTKKWYYSIDGGTSWEDRAEGGLKEFDKNGSPIHISEVWGVGLWKDENTIHWKASNGSESIWKALDNPPNQ